MMHAAPQRGFTLLIAVILSSVVLTVGLSLLDVAYKQVVLSSTAKQSQTAFYNADSALECALYYDQKQDAFDFTTPAPASSLTCSSTPVTGYSTNADSVKRITIFTLPCAGGGTYATTTIYKYSTGATTLYANGFNTCNASDPRRIERGLKASYGVVASGGGSTSSPPVGGAEIIPAGFSQSSNYSGDTGSGPNAMRDGIFNTIPSVIGTLGDASSWATVDLGSAQPVGHIEVVPIPASFQSWGAAYLNGASVQYSTDNATWTTVGTISGATEGTYTSISLGSVSARYIRIVKGPWLGIGDFKVFAP